ncbi:MAG: hypothetical protein COB37_01895 [Kordiimonadales bacterium]|nr:MAG: hypothetical protein COB37_01895 [Kordiimonadales bacterium]
MPTAFVTGATGFLGRHIIDVLLEAGWDVTAMVRDTAAAAKILSSKVTLIKGDLSQPETIRGAMPTGLDCVFHAAADTSTWNKEAERQAHINIEGTATLLQVILDKEVKRMVHVSSIAVFGDHTEVITEETSRSGASSWISYSRTKAYAERKVKEAVDRGLDATIVNPTHIVGRYDAHNWARLITMLAAGKLPGTPPGNGNFANGRAVAEAILAAYHNGKSGENYILGGPSASFFEFLSIAATKLNIAPPKKPTPAFLLRIAASFMTVFAAFSGKRPMMTPEEAHFSCEKMEANCEKAVRELGYEMVPLERSIDECIAYCREQGAL